MTSVKEDPLNITEYAQGLVRKYRGRGGPEQRGGESPVFEPLVTGGLFNFLLPIRDGLSYFITRIGPEILRKNNYCF